MEAVSSPLVWPLLSLLGKLSMEILYLFLLFVHRWSFSESFCVRKPSNESAGHVAPKVPGTSRS